MNNIRYLLTETHRQFISHIASRPMTLERGSTIVSFCFDDFPRSALAAGGAILQANGACGTYYAALGWMDAHNECGEQFHREDLDSVIREGHELGCQTFQHLSCRSVAPSTFERDVIQGRQALRDITGYDPVDFAYPYGDVTAFLKKRVGERMDSCRGSFGGVNGRVVDLNLLRANRLYGDADRLGSILELLGHASAGGWLIFYTHDVRKHPSRYGCTPDLLAMTLNRVLKEGFTVAPIAAVVAAARRTQNLESNRCG
jgi:peptidoglycan/xylan/chitin deacetylase (PgdA/CDA1 family)